MANSVIKKYSLRLFGSDVHAFEFTPSSNTTLALCKCGMNREPVSKIKHKWFTDNGFERIFGINASLFASPIYQDDESSNSTISWLEMLFTKSGKLVFEELTQALYNDTYKADTRFGVSIPIFLLKDGEINLKGIENFDTHSYNTKHSRSFIGWNAVTGTVTAVVVDGGNRYSTIEEHEFSLGVTPYEAAVICKLLGLTDAGLLDGGDAATMVEKDTVLNNASRTGKEIPVASALNLFVRGKAIIHPTFNIADIHDSTVYKVIIDSLGVRDSHNANSNVLTTIPKNERVLAYGRVGKWVLINPIKSYWVDSTYIKEVSNGSELELYINELRQYIKSNDISQVNMTEEHAIEIASIVKKYTL